MSIAAAMLLVLRPVSKAIADSGASIALDVLLITVAFYGPLAGVCVWASHRWGTGSVRQDFGFAFRAIDALWAVIGLVLAWLAEIGTAILVRLLGIPIGTNTDVIRNHADSRNVYLALAASAVIAAPIVEELFFRGLVMRALRGKLSGGTTIVAQGLIFGAYHMDVSRGWSNIGLALVLASVGMVLGLLARTFRRLGPDIGAHALFNGVVFAVLYLSR
jgi:membrane protease YdiL (CAAX protease family)